MGGALAGGGALGPVGAIGGGLLGGLAGLFGGGGNQDIRNQLLQLSQHYGQMQAPQMGPAYTAQNSPYEAQRAGFLNQLQAWANGQGPSAALQQMRQGMSQAAASQQGTAGAVGARGGTGYGGAQLQAANNTAALQGQTNQNMGIVRSQEQMNAMGQLGQALQGAVGQTNDMSQFNASAQNQNQQANLAARLQAMGITTNAQLQALIAAMGGAPPGLGTSILAGGAQMFPFLSGQAAAGKAAQPGSQVQTFTNPSAGPVY